MKQASIEDARKELYNVVSINIFTIKEFLSINLINYKYFSILPMVIFHEKHMIYTQNLMVLLTM